MEHKEELHNPKIPSTRFKCSKIKVQGGSIYFYCFKTFEAGDFVIEFESLLKTLGCSSVLPTEAFLKPSSSSGREFVITADGGSPRDINFLLFASGIMDDSYQGTLFRCWGLGVGGGFKNEWNPVPGVVEGIQDCGIYDRKEPKRGDVEGWNARYPNGLSHFCVLMEDHSDPRTTIFGRVKRGMEVVDQIKWANKMTECGLIFDLS